MLVCNLEYILRTIFELSCPSFHHDPEVQSLSWALVQELSLSFHSQESLLVAIHPNRALSQVL